MFFFFKQKTAYEMRISDWSSDVCSSDLHRHVADGLLAIIREHEAIIARAQFPAPTQNGNRCLGERHHMRFLCLHALAGNGPDRLVEVDLGPNGLARLA